MTCNAAPADITSGFADFLLLTRPYNTWSMASLSTLCASATVAQYAVGTQISLKPDRPAHISVLGDGTLSMTVTLANGLEQVLTHLHAGALIGLAGAFGEATPGEHQFYRIHTRATLWHIPIDTFRACMASDAAMMETVIGVLATTVRRMADEIANTALLPARARVARCVLGPLTKSAVLSWTQKGQTITLSQAQIASMLGLSRQSVGLFLREFEAAGLLHIGRNRVKLLQPETLQAILSGVQK